MQVKTRAMATVLVLATQFLVASSLDLDRDVYAHSFIEFRCNTTLSPSELIKGQDALIAEHIRGDAPAGAELTVRNAYVTVYDEYRKVPKWVAYHITNDYLNTPPRTGRFNTFRRDPELADPVCDADYKGLFADFDLVRGHLVPFNVSGGDRDEDGTYANGPPEGALSDNSDDDVEDFQTVVQVNYLSNVAPQFQSGFNNAGGPWGDLELFTWNNLVDEEHEEVWVIAGTVFEDEIMPPVGPFDVHVPSAYYKIVLMPPDEEGDTLVLAFLMPHVVDRRSPLRCFLTSIVDIELRAATDFFTSPEATLTPLQQLLSTQDNAAEFRELLEVRDDSEDASCAEI